MMDIETYLKKVPQGRRRLVIGCGATPKDGCSYGLDHKEDFTIDPNLDVGANLAIDLVTYKGTDLYTYGGGCFDEVRFENVCRGGSPFKREHTLMWILAARDLLKNGGSIYYFNYDYSERCFVKGELYKLRFSVRDWHDVAYVRGKNYKSPACLGVKDGKGRWNFDNDSIWSYFSA